MGEPNTRDHHNRVNQLLSNTIDASPDISMEFNEKSKEKHIHTRVPAAHFVRDSRRRPVWVELFQTSFSRHSSATTTRRASRARIDRQVDRRETRRTKFSAYKSTTCNYLPLRNRTHNNSNFTPRISPLPAFHMHFS